MPSFFVPSTKTDEQAEEVWEATKRFAADQFSWTVSDRRIYSLSYVHNGQRGSAEVGKVDERQGEVVLVILESSGPYLVCTATRGVAQGMPILVGREEALQVINFT